jgi:hypothetical protein
MSGKRFKDWKQGEVRAKLHVVYKDGSVTEIYAPHLHPDWGTFFAMVTMLLFGIKRKGRMTPGVQKVTQKLVDYGAAYMKRRGRGRRNVG